MNVAQHASSILDAWRFQDKAGLESALQRASFSDNGLSGSRLEHERTEVLESIVEHLRKLEAVDHMPQLSRNAGATALLRHLSLVSSATFARDLD